jgi:hypothetical protein
MDPNYPTAARTPPDGASTIVDPVVNKASVGSGKAASRLPDTASQKRSISILTPTRHTVRMPAIAAVVVDSRWEAGISSPIKLHTRATSKASLAGITPAACPARQAASSRMRG